MNDTPIGLSESSLGKEIPRPLEQIVLRTLAKDPEKRYSSMQELRADLIAFKQRNFEQITATTTARALPHTDRASASKRNWLGAGACLLIVLAALGAWLGKPIASHSTPATPTATILADDPGIGKDFMETNPDHSIKSEVESLVKKQREQNLPSLSLSGIAEFNKLDDQAIASLSQTTLALKILDLHANQGSQITDAGLEYIKHLKLTKLDVSQSLVANLSALKGMSSLKYLKLGQSGITRDGLAVIASLPNLHNVNLESNLSISNDDIAILGRLKKLKALSLERCNLSFPVVRRLQTALPHCLIWFGADMASSRYPEILQAEKLTEKKNWTDATKIWDRVLKLAIADRDLEAQAECLEAMSNIQHIVKNNKLALQLSKTAVQKLTLAAQELKFVSRYMPLQLAKLLMQTASICESEGTAYSLEEAIRFREQSLETVQSFNLERARAITELDFIRITNHKRLGIDWILMGDGNQATKNRATKEFDLALGAIKADGTEQQVALCQVDFADAWLSKHDEIAAEIARGLYEEALPILRITKNYDVRPVIWSLAQAAYKSDQTAECRHTQESEALLVELLGQTETSPMSRLKQLRLMIDVSKKLNKDAQATKYQTMFAQLKDSNTVHH